eukprot:GHVN01104258.1.p2 GENE.GHVN01104258.1~~GHVN01104258.1.p2  ORF type:complete len:122 (+),score=33.05 GHVN01104258.1:1453-1818(+)
MGIAILHAQKLNASYPYLLGMTTAQLYYLLTEVRELPASLTSPYSPYSPHSPHLTSITTNPSAARVKLLSANSHHAPHLKKITHPHLLCHAFRLPHLGAPQKRRAQSPCTTCVVKEKARCE